MAVLFLLPKLRLTTPDRLRGVTSARDAIGANVTVICGARKRVKQITAGDDCQASNERHLTFGLGASTVADHVGMRWPSGLTQTFKNLPDNNGLRVIENTSALITLRPH